MTRLTCVTFLGSLVFHRCCSGVVFVCASDSLLKSAKAKVVAAVAVAVAAAIATNREEVVEEEGEGEGAARGRREVAKEPVARGWVQEDVGGVVEKEAKEAIERGDVRCRRSRRRRTLIAIKEDSVILSTCEDTSEPCPLWPPLV